MLVPFEFSSVFFLLCLFSCLTQDMSLLNRFSTKNPYFFHNHQIAKSSIFEAKKVWSIIRHGTRLPGKKIISRYNGLTELRDDIIKSSRLNEEEKSAFREWTPMNINLEHQKFLTKQGEIELHRLGMRFRDRFPTFFDDASSQFRFKHTPTQRTELSAKRFIGGLFPNSSNRHQSKQVERDDPVLRPYKGCPLWNKNVKKNPDALKEKKAFLSGEIVENLVNEFREVTQINHLKFRDIELIYTICGFETAWQHKLFNNQSLWCTLFKNEHQIKIMEFLEDLEYYWIDGPGFEVTRKVACKTVEDILHNFDDASSLNTKKLTFYFTHSGTILKLLTFLNMYRDDFELTADKFHHERQWRTSFIDTFSTNLVFILYE